MQEESHHLLYKKIDSDLSNLQMALEIDSSYSGLLPITLESKKLRQELYRIQSRIKDAETEEVNISKSITIEDILEIETIIHDPESKDACFESLIKWQEAYEDIKPAQHKALKQARKIYSTFHKTISQIELTKMQQLISEQIYTNFPIFLVKLDQSASFDPIPK